MECNKDEAIRAKAIAESKMMNNDFEGARKIALKAKRLFPELDNISQMLTVCDVHCSSQQKIHGSEMDLYGILQVESVADEVTIRKQYRKLALVLHPDKNKFPGAEAAFKLIGQANMILSDKGKRHMHDIKCRQPAVPSIPRPPNYQGSQNSHVGMQFGAQSKHYNVPSSQFSGLNHVPQSQSDSNGQPSFWTCCPFCKIKYEYYRDLVNKRLRCPTCYEHFTAFEIGGKSSAKARAGVQAKARAGVQSVNLGASAGRPVFSQREDVGRQGTAKVDAQCQGTEGAKIGGNPRTRTGESGKNTDGGKKAFAMPKRNKGRKKVVESSESGSDVGEASKGTGGDPSVGSDSNGRRSRKRPQVSNSEEAVDGFSPGKRARLRKLSRDVDADLKKDACEPKASARVEESVLKAKFEEKDKSEAEDKSNSDSKEISEPKFIACSDLEFSNFDKDKEKDRFAADQIWACYDTIDGMPRFYALVRKVYSTGFRLRITWLEADPDDYLEAMWVEEGLPVSCGKFVRGSTEDTRDHLMFSHQMTVEKGSGRLSYVIYPKKGEIWALFKDWDINWGSNPKKHMNYQFEIVEVLSDFNNGNGVLVAYMVKVEGFVSLFQRTSRARLAEQPIPPNELFRFSHRIPSVKLTGTERADVPVGSYELDTASLPDDLDQFCFSNKVKMKPESVSDQVNASCSQPPEAKVKSTTGLPGTPKKFVNSEGKNEFERETLNLRRSPRGFKGGDKNNKTIPCSKQGDKFGQPSGVEDNSNSATQSKSDDVNRSSNGCTKIHKLISSSYGKEAKLTIHDFNEDKQNWEFKEGDIWALRRSKYGHLGCYAQIKQIESSPHRLHVDLLQLCSPDANINSSGAYGLFKVSPGKREIVLWDAFLYPVKAERNGKTKFNIYPKEKEIWLLCNKQDIMCTFSDLDSHKCDIVEVLEFNGQVCKVLPLSHVAGTKSIFKAQDSKASVLDDINRFCYRVPAFLLTNEQDGRLKGFWELDLAEDPGMLPS